MTAAENPTHELIRQGQALVHSLASRIHHNIPVRVELDDLIAYGEVGLAEAARDYNPTLGTQFTTFAYYRIRGAIYDGLSKMSWTSRARYNRMRYDHLAGEAMAGDSDDGVLSLEDESRWFSRLTERLAIVFLASQRDSGEGGIRDSAIADPSAMAPTTIAAHREIGQKLRELVDRLPNDERRLIHTIYFEGATLQEAADRIGISKSWASRRHAKILEQLARQMRRYGAAE